MIVMLNTSHDLEQCERELGRPVEQLFTPLNSVPLRRAEARFAIDNGAYSDFSPSRFRNLLARHEARRHLCRFVAAPDVVASARRTLELFDCWYEDINQWPLALVAQDGLEDLTIPWRMISAVFIGGTTRWKLSGAARDVIKAAQALGKWTHAGRVNTPARFEYFETLGVDSVDGTKLARFSIARERIFAMHNTPTLFNGHNT
jgi:hypothetical protein